VAQPIVLAELKRLRARRQLEQAKDSTNTQGISRKAADLTRDHVTSVIRDRFTRESDRLKLERVTLVDVGGKKGNPSAPTCVCRRDPACATAQGAQ
jgi:hypothetical protein